ncbi:hypothetical protein GQR58_030001 [Nymphon striatum]|nr:hypothetical protein GQR58_030001 [Nymphon striatum]
MRRLVIPILCLMAGCVPSTKNEVPGRSAPVATSLPPMKTFTSQRGGGVNRQTPKLPRFSRSYFPDGKWAANSVANRFEGPIKVAVTGQAPASLEGDLARLLSRLRSRLGSTFPVRNQVAIRLTNEGIPAARNSSNAALLATLLMIKRGA